MVALRQPDGTRHVIILKVSLGVCTLIKQENGFCGPSRENERKGELNYRPSPLHKPCISCFIACQKNPAPVDGRICNSARVRRAGGVARGESPSLCVTGHVTHFVFVSACLCFSDRAKGIKESYGNARHSCASWVSCPKDSFTEASFTILITLLIYPTCFCWLKKTGPIHQMKTMRPCFTFAIYSN